jgi:toxin FitB
MIIDTNVVSEAMRGDPDGVVTRFLSVHPEAALSMAAVTVQEVTYGLARMPAGRRKEALSSIWAEIHAELAERIHPLDAATAIVAGELLATGEATGRGIGLPDAQIAATCLVRGESLATRNVRDFEGLGIQVVNPWDGA